MTYDSTQTEFKMTREDALLWALETAMCQTAVAKKEMERYKDRVASGLGRLYRDMPADVAKVCDEIIDPSGALLGEVRKKSRE